LTSQRVSSPLENFKLGGASAVLKESQDKKQNDFGYKAQKTMVDVAQW
jgi:hypothetical protein